MAREPRNSDTITAHHAALRTYRKAHKSEFQAAKGNKAEMSALRKTQRQTVNKQRPEGGWNPSQRVAWPQNDVPIPFHPGGHTLDDTARVTTTVQSGFGMGHNTKQESAL